MNHQSHQEYNIPPYPPPAYSQIDDHQTNARSAEFQQHHFNSGFEEAEEMEREEEVTTLGEMSHQCNWPPFPKNCCLKPFTYQDINVEIAHAERDIARIVYLAWIYHVMLLLLNLLGASMVLLYRGTAITFLMAILYCFLYTPLSYLCWYRPAYRALRDKRSLDFVVFFLSCFIQFLITLTHCIGLSGGEACDMHLAINILGSNEKTGFSKVFVGLFVIFIALCFGVAALMDLFIMFKVHSVYTSCGASLNTAMAELPQNLISYRHFVYVEPMQVQQTVSVQVRSEIYPVQAMPSMASV